MDPLALPLSVLLALWAPFPSSQGRAVVQGPDGVHEVIDDVSPWGLGRMRLEEWVAAFAPLARTSAVLPSPADPLPGLAAALDVGEGVVAEASSGRRVLLVPWVTGTSVTWQVEEMTTLLPPADASQARRDVHAATEAAIDALIELDLARERPELADTLNDVVTAVVNPRLLPPTLDARRRTLLERSLRLRAICMLALEDDGAAATARQADERAQVLRPLLATARHGVAAATEWWAR
ncbi:hypothetical protein [Actinomyces sp. MRS3W]|uniref:hypothetical protein n=1 Tax=Actinomyces sp. MRS3W TaxID=2800796 RepID=UPI0028FDB5C7|nr:hypothetical protein [Actinomyces sp. MRS3W]MDU0349486.1 hypothetical protein [Actinomyces sp. MRS3W]